jgi:hypothetical protein
LRLQNAYDMLEARRKIARGDEDQTVQIAQRYNLGRMLCEPKRNPVIASARCVRAGFSHHSMSRSRFRASVATPGPACALRSRVS